MADKSPYDTLGLHQSADAATIRKAYRRRASEAHPDRHGGSTEEMQAVNEAYAILSDAERRRRFDETGDKGGEGSLEDIARGLLCNELAKIVDAEAWNDPLVSLKAAIDKIQADTIRAYATHTDRLKTLRDRSRSFAAREGVEDFLRPVFSKRIEEAEAALIACEKLNAAAKRAREIVAVYRFENFLLATSIRMYIAP